MRTTTLPLLALIFTQTTADFLLSNTTICMGAFPISNCYQGPVVLSEAGNINITGTCSKMLHAEETSYVYNGTMNGPELWSNGTCGMEALRFERKWEAPAGEDGYLGFDVVTGVQVADCVSDKTGFRHCNQWVGSVFFNQSQYCQSELTCGT